MKELCYGKILLASINANLSTIKLIFNTIKSNGFCYLNQLTGEFGWLETDVSIIFTLFVLFSLFIVSFFNTKSNKKEQKKQLYIFKKWEFIYLYVFGIIMILIVVLSLFQWTLFLNDIPNSDSLSISQYTYLIKDKIDIIIGVQGRYFIPIIPVFFLPLYSKFMDKIVNKVNVKFYLLSYYSIVFVYMFFIILNRYWIR